MIPTIGSIGIRTTSGSPFGLKRDIMRCAPFLEGMKDCPRRIFNKPIYFGLRTVIPRIVWGGRALKCVKTKSSRSTSKLGVRLHE